MSLAAAAAGADGLIIEVHPDPDKAFSDAEQALTPAEYSQLSKQVARVRQAIERSGQDL